MDTYDHVNLEYQPQDYRENQQHKAEEEAYFYHTLHDFESLLNHYGAEFVIKHMKPKEKGMLYQELDKTMGEPF